MRLQLISFLVLFSSICKGQNVIDSVLSKEWTDDFNSKIYFENDSHLIYENSLSGLSVKANYQINDKLIQYQYQSDTSWHQVKYKYLTDSLVIYSDHYDFLWLTDCLYGRFPDHEPNKIKWVYYSTDYLNAQPFDFKKLQIFDWKVF